MSYLLKIKFVIYKKDIEFQIRSFGGTFTYNLITPKNQLGALLRQLSSTSFIDLS